MVEVEAVELSSIDRAIRAAGLQSKLLLRGIYLPQVIDAVDTLHAPDRLLTSIANNRRPHHRYGKCDPDYYYK